MEKPIHIRLSQQASDQIDEAVRISGKVRADIMRDALALGLDALARVGYDLQGYAVRKFAEEEAKKTAPMLTALKSPPKTNGGKKAK